MTMNVKSRWRAMRETLNIIVGTRFCASVTLIALTLMLAACDAVPDAPQATPTIATFGRVNQPKRIATVFLSPTPNEAEQQATRIASSPTPDTFASPTPIPSPTVYVGVFLGDSASGAPVVDIEGFDGAPPTVTPVLTRCPLAPATDIFGTTWQNDTDVTRRLGCAIEGPLPFRGVTQTFENGVMFARPEVSVWALVPGAPGQYWTLERLPEIETDNIDAPPGLLPPAPSFVLMWQGVAGVREAVGYAEFQELETDLTLQRFEGGTLLQDGASGQVFALMLNNEVFGPY